MQFFKLFSVYAIHLGLQELTPYTYSTFSLSIAVWPVKQILSIAMVFWLHLGIK